MGAPGLTTGLRAETFDNLQLNAGVLLKDFDYDTPTDAAALKTAIAAAITSGDILGATRGGGEFHVTRETRDPEIDGKRYGYKGGLFVDSADAYLNATLVEVTPDNVKVLLATGEATTSGKKTVVKMHTAIEDGDYLENLCWAGDLADGRLVLIVLKNAMNTADFTLTFQDKNEGTLAAEFHAHQDSFDDYDYAPFEVIFFDKAAGG